MELNSKEYLQNVIINRNFDYSEAELYQLGNEITSEYKREQLWKSLNNNIIMDWEQEDHQLNHLNYSEACWWPIDKETGEPKMKLNKISIYPWKASRLEDAQVRRYCLAPYLEGANLKGMKAIHLCGYGSCCNPSHQLLVPKALKTVMEKEGVDSLDITRRAIKLYIQSKHEFEITEIVRTIEQELVMGKVISPADVSREFSIAQLFRVYQVGPTAQAYLKGLIKIGMKGSKLEKVERDALELERYLLVLEGLGFKKYENLPQETNEIEDIITEVEHYDYPKDNEEVTSIFTEEDWKSLKVEVQRSYIKEAEDEQMASQE